MDLRRLRHFVVAAEESNFRRAALRLDTNQSSSRGMFATSKKS
jgi:DNA-binding transcriptional LysR family regulator